MIKQDEFCAALKIALHSAAGTKELRQNLRSVLFRFHGPNQLELVSTNGHAISVVQLQTGGDPYEDMDFLVQKCDIEELSSLFKPKTDKEITITVLNNVIYLSNWQDIRSFSSLEETFPDYKPVLVKGGTPAPKVRFSAVLIEKAIKACKDIVDKKATGLDIELQDEHCIAYLKPVLKDGLENIQGVTIGVMPQRDDSRN